MQDTLKILLFQEADKYKGYCLKNGKIISTIHLDLKPNTDILTESDVLEILPKTAQYNIKIEIYNK